MCRKYITFCVFRTSHGLVVWMPTGAYQSRRTRPDQTIELANVVITESHKYYNKQLFPKLCMCESW